MPMATTILTLSFQNNGWDYQVYHHDHCEQTCTECIGEACGFKKGSTEKGMHCEDQCGATAGVRVSRNDKNPTEIQCKHSTSATGLWNLEGFVRSE